LRNNDSGCRVLQVRYFPATFKGARKPTTRYILLGRDALVSTALFPASKRFCFPTEWDLFWHLAADKRFGFVHISSLENPNYSPLELITLRIFASFVRAIYFTINRIKNNNVSSKVLQFPRKGETFLSRKFAINKHRAD